MVLLFLKAIDHYLYLLTDSEIFRFLKFTKKKKMYSELYMLRIINLLINYIYILRKKTMMNQTHSVILLFKLFQNILRFI